MASAAGGEASEEYRSLQGKQVLHTLQFWLRALHCLFVPAVTILVKS